MQRPFRTISHATLSIALVSLAAGAQEAKPKPREFTADVGFVSATGNSDVTTFNLGERLILRSPTWEHRQQFGSIYGSRDGEESANLLFANWRSDRALNEWLSVFGFAGYDRNPFAGIARRFEEAAGLAAKLVRTERDQWGVELGFALTQQRSVDDISNSFPSLRSGTLFKHFFTETAYFSQGVEYLPSLEVSQDYRINSETAIVAPISTHIAMKLGYSVRFDNLPELGKRKSDRILTSGLQFNW